MEPVVQWVRTSWTKASRGGSAATRRNAAPVAFRLPRGAGPLTHEVVMREEDGFAPHIGHRFGLPRRDDVDLRVVDGRLRVLPAASPYGMPRRNRRPPAVTLAPGQWLRWHLNHRFPPVCSCGAQWSYRLDTWNIGYGPLPVDAFLGEPDRLVDERGYLR